jgi:hypothetical protein
MIIARQSTARTVTVGPMLDAAGAFVSDGVVADFKISKNGGAPAALNGSATLTHRNTGHYSLALTASDLDTVGQAEIVIDDTVNGCPIKEITVVEEAVYDLYYAAAATGKVTLDNTAHGGAAATLTLLSGVISNSGGIGLSVTGTTDALKLIATAGDALHATAAGGLAAKFEVTSGNHHGVSINGFGAGNGLRIEGGATGQGIASIGGATSGNAVMLSTTDGHGIDFSIAGAGKVAFNAGVALTAAGVQAIWDALTAALTTANSIGKLLVDNINATISSRSSHTAANVRTEMDANSTKLADILADTDDIGVAGAGLTAIPWNAAWDAEVQSEAEDAIVVHRLDELLNADSDIDGAAPPTVGSVFHELLSKTAGSFTFDQTTDSLEALRDKAVDIETDTQDIQSRLPAALTGAGNMKVDVLAWLGTAPATPTVAGVPKVDVTHFGGMAGAFTFGIPSTNVQLWGGTTAQLTPELLPLVGVGGIGAQGAVDLRAALGLASANLDTQLGDIPTVAEFEARTLVAANYATAANQTTIIGYLDTEIAAILAAVDTEIAAIKAKTDNLPASPAATGDAMTLTSGERDAVAAALLDLAAGIETNRTLRQAMRLILATAVGKLSGAATNTVAIRDTNDTKDRVTATVDGDGNRSVVTLDAS